MKETRTAGVREWPQEGGFQIQPETRKYGHPLKRKYFVRISPFRGEIIRTGKFGNTDKLAEFRASA